MRRKMSPAHVHVYMAIKKWKISSLLVYLYSLVTTGIAGYNHFFPNTQPYKFLSMYNDVGTCISIKTESLLDTVNCI